MAGDLLFRHPLDDCFLVLLFDFHILDNARGIATGGSGIETIGKLEFEIRNCPRKRKPWLGFRN
jgi:hypothetical protein